MSVLTYRVKEVLSQSGYNHFYIDEEVYKKIIDIYNRYEINVSQSAKDIIKVFGGRDIFYFNNSNPHRKDAYHLSFYYNLINFSGEIKPYEIQHELSLISSLQRKLEVSYLIPFCVMPSGPMVFYLDEKDRIFGSLDNFIICYDGGNVGSSLDKLFNGDYKTINEQENLTEIYLKQKYGKSKK